MLTLGEQRLKDLRSDCMRWTSNVLYVLTITPAIDVALPEEGRPADVSCTKSFDELVWPFPTDKIHGR